MFKTRQSIFKSLQSQLLIRFLLLIVTLLVLLGITQYNGMKKYLYASKVDYLDSRFRNINADVIINSTSDELVRNNTYYFLNQIADLDICAVVIDQKGEQIGIKNYYSGIKTKTRDELDKLPMSVPTLPLKTYEAILSHDEMPSGYDVIEDGEGKMQLVIYRKLGSLSNPSGIIQISTYIEPIQRVLNEQLKGLVIYGGLVIVIGGILTFSLIQMTLIPLKKMQLVLSKVTPSELHYRLDEVTSQVEINEVSQSVNQMIERLERSFTKEKQTNDKMRVFISDVSHELRTPLTSIQGFVEVLQMGAAKNENHLDKALNSILMETQRLSKLVNYLLLLTKLDNQVTLEVEKEDVSEVIQEILPQLEILVGNKTLKMNLTPHLNSLINRDQIKQVIYNLVQNAIHYTDPDTGVIQVETKQVNRNNQPYVAINIMDNGKGMSPENLEKIFDRFYRIDEDRARHTGGYGLGLAIVKSIVEQHSGLVLVKSVINEGTTFTVYLKCF